MKEIQEMILQYEKGAISQLVLSNFIEMNIDKIDPLLRDECEKIILENQFNIIYPNSERRFKLLVDELISKMVKNI